MKDFEKAYEYYKERETVLGNKEKEHLSTLTKLNDLYTELEYETDKLTIAKIKRQIRKIEKKLKEGE